MRYQIEHIDGVWVLTCDGVAVGVPHDTHQLAMGALTERINADLAAASGGGDGTTGILPQRWTSDAGICFAESLASGRDFTQCEWSWRDPATSFVPLMFQPKNAGHYDAELCGFVSAFTGGGVGTVGASGGFLDNEAGRAAAAILEGAGRFGVSVDPSEKVDVVWQCTEMDEDGWCMAGLDMFMSYEIAGITMTPLQAFDNAAIVLDGAAPAADPAPADDVAEPVAAAAFAIVAAADLVRPPAEWFSLAEPQIGEAFLGTLGDEFLVDQGDGTVACPLTITDEGQVFGHLARWGQCHVGYGDQCVSPPESLTAYSHFHVSSVLTAEGELVAVGALTVGCEHAPPTMPAWQAQDHYANSGSGWADVRCSNGVHGPWISGALRPGLDDAALRVLRALTLSGDWRDRGAGLELIAGLSVNVPGFPIARESLAASGLLPVRAPMTASASKAGRLVSLTAAGLVARCPDCQKRSEAARVNRDQVLSVGGQLDRIEAMLSRVDRRTAHLNVDAAAAVLRRIG
jgi:hypothetical protein